MTSSPPLPADWPGKRLGLPETGPRSVARFGRRFLAIVIDWAIASGVAYLFLDGDWLAILLAFALLQYVAIVLLSGSIGHLIMGLRVVPVNPAWIGVIKPLVRTVLLCLVLPAIIWDRDQRGFHDKFAATILVRR